ncbi:NAD(P)/FAD-dependent oxidoreductase [Streptomyces sp. MB09-01]|uniref:FAD/NAD(P)-dependent oxidoreductase n=1 Tax=Streptomyces sp. MB09-01 TaxID=3028666 RepID=UPI0029ADCF37|nr:NAD(P)/FAD-dependent oxidoreductase [Streptomyces sp. MB09-01]MDX3536472.1 NAD(P)/FAD-dependent oxidoreductase [Streptomyces sp. MB09-01]
MPLPVAVQVPAAGSASGPAPARADLAVVGSGPAGPAAASDSPAVAPAARTSGPAASSAAASAAAPAASAGAHGFDLAVVGAGPAGLAAAVTAAGLGLRVALLDAGERPGGQYYRHPAPGLGAARPEALHHGWAEFATREAALRAHESAGRITYLPLHHVWTVVPGRAAAPATDWTLHAVAGPEEAAASVDASAVLIATGAHERQLPFPGWTLPGVVGAGGAQAMLKAGLVLPGKRVVVAGSGPLLLAVAGSLAAAGATVPAVVEAAAYTAYAGRIPVLLRNPGKLVEAAGYGGALARHHVRLLTRHAVTEAHGTDRVEAVTVARLDREWRPLPGTARRIPCDALAVGHGLVPQLELATGLGCATRRSPDGTVALVLDAEQRTSVPGIWSAGETGGIGGAQLAMAEGELAAHSIAGVPCGPRLTRRRARLRAFADAMAAAHRPGAGWTGWVRDDAVVCRCEEVPAGRIREAAEDLGARDARTVKLLTRAGMGWCQGRMCGPAVAALAGEEQPADRRPLSCPVPLRRLAELPPADR